ncbi:methyltransferase [Bdellovibrio bacteriovorus]|uniref:S-adenosyl-L-methionine-dependent methyltransferase n=1 Tax=Bdellovibrio bacteriovorus TaxID=959 RepID=A0A150WUC3_BDEBC|nr:class I SAM-dependent methyltransferase [Bdellovibrio bacteriovorus]KYG70021.1 methyltransferase [Bdellovibrio bacteriovorus]
MTDKYTVAPEHTAVRVALWRALHVKIDPPPHIFTDEVGAALVDEKDWQNRQDMAPGFSKSMRASIVGRARFIEDLLKEEIKNGVTQYVILGAGLDTFAQRHPNIASHIQIFEVDQPGPQAWKKKRLLEKGFEIPESLHFVPVDFEAGESWWDRLLAAGFNPAKPAFVVSTGVSMYLTKETNLTTFQQIAKLAKGSTFATTFMLSLDLLPDQERSIMEFVMKKAAESGTPFNSLFSPEEILALARKAGFSESKYVSAQDIYNRYFSLRTDGLSAGTAEAFLVATT